MFLHEKKAKEKACSLYTQLLGLEEAMENTAVCAPRTSESTAVLATQTVG